jgi:hypothetical protein
MPLDLQIIRASEFIRLGPQGHFDVAASRKVLAELAGACRKRGVERALLDLRSMRPGPTPIFTPDDLACIVNTFREMGFTRQQRLAVLYAEDPHHRARDFAFIGRLRGWHVCAFDDFEAALAWLSVDDLPSRPEPNERGEAVPVKAAPRPPELLPKVKPRIKPRR